MTVFIFSTVSWAQEVNGVMMVVKGDIKVTSGKDQKTEAAKVGKKVFSGDTITAGPDSRAKIVMSDKNVLNISPDSKLVIEKYTNNGDSKNVELKVEYGKIRASVEQKYDGEKSKFNVKTPSAVAGVRGTDFLTGFNPATKQSQVITFSGTVAVGQPGPGGSIVNPVFVQPGQMTTASEGKGPEAPKSVPKEELNKMNQETVAAPTSNENGNSAVADNKEAKEEKKEEQKEAVEDKKANNDEKPKEEAKQKEESKVAKDEPKKGDDSNKPKEENRKPSSEQASDGKGPNNRGPSMIDSKDLGPELSKDINVRGTPAGAPQPPPMVNFQPGTGTFFNQPTTNQFINNAIQNQKSRTTIIINQQ